MKFEFPATRYLIKPGYLITYHNPMVVYGVLGSGVMVALWDRKKRYSGCCFYIYPHTKDRKKSTVKFGNVAISHLIKKMKSEGSSPEDLRAHIIGGSIKIDGDMGEKNSNIAKHILEKENIEILTYDIGGKLGRKFAYDSSTGQHITMKVNHIRSEDWYPYINQKRAN